MLLFHFFLLFHSDVWGLHFSVNKQGFFIYIYRYQSFRQENQSRLLHIFLDAPVCNEIRGNHMGIIHYAILSWEFKHRGNFYNLLKTKITYIYMQYIIYNFFWLAGSSNVSFLNHIQDAIFIHICFPCCNHIFRF